MSAMLPPRRRRRNPAVKMNMALHLPGVTKHNARTAQSTFSM
jgi:hypothetical protein